LRTAHGVVETPNFMPVATQATVKGITPAQLSELGAEMILSNAYHLAVRPGVALIRDLGGLHRFMGWDGPILTDSGGYQVFSLSALRQVTDEGVTFRSHVDGARMFFSPADVVGLQVDLGVDVIMVLDECAPAGATHGEAAGAARRTLDWARRSRQVPTHPGQAMFGIVQGAVYADLRRQQARDLVDLGFTGYAVGGLSVGEERSVTMAIAADTVDALPADHPRYLMGVGFPEDLVQFVGMGYDLFDCVLPTRNGRNASCFTAAGRVNMRLARHARDEQPIDPTCGCEACRTVSRAYVRHLCVSGEMLGAQLCSLHNVHFYLDLMRQARAHIAAGDYTAWATARAEAMERGEGA